MENQFKDKRLNELSEAIEKFVKNYDTEGNDVSLFLVIAEQQEDGIQVSSVVKGKPLKITEVVNNVIKDNKELKTASLINSLMAFGAMKSEKRTIWQARLTS